MADQISKAKLRNKSNISSHLSDKNKKQINLSSNKIDIYALFSKFEKDIKRINNPFELNRIYPCEKIQNHRSAIKFNSNNEIINYKLKNQIKNLGFCEKEDKIFDTTEEIFINIHPIKIERLIDEVENHSENSDLINPEKIDFNEINDFEFGANLIVRNLESQGAVYLGSNSYKHNIENLKYFNTIINVIGEFPENEFNPTSIEIIEKSVLHDDFHSRIVRLTSGHQVNFIIKTDESLKKLNKLSQIMFEKFNKGDSVLVHCEQGLVRSATLMLFFLRKYFFTNIRKANEFISLKRKGAESPNLFLPIIEKLVMKSEDI